MVENHCTIQERAVRILYPKLYLVCLQKKESHMHSERMHNNHNNHNNLEIVQKYHHKSDCYI